MKTSDVIVIGVGGMGSATCYHLAKRGIKVIGLEQFTLAHDRGSSHGDTRLIRKAYFEHPDYVPLLKRAYENWEALEKEFESQLLFKTGLVLYGPSQNCESHKGILAAAKTHKLHISQLSYEEVLKIYPMFRPPENYKALFEPYAGFLKVESCVEAHASQAKKLGAHIHENELVISWEVSKGSVIVKTDKDSYQAKKLIVTAGPWSFEILKDLNIPLTVHRNVQFWFPCSDAYRQSTGTPCFALDSPNGFFYGMPSIDKWGLKIAEHTPGPIIDHPNDLDRKPNPDDIKPIRKCMQSFLPDIPRRPTKEVICMYTMTPDKHFVVDYHPNFPEVCFAAGFSGHGFKFSSVMGEILCDLSLNGKTNHPIDFLKWRWP
jgi:sarcosine oxidase